jgi:hypothetical protein
MTRFLRESLAAASLHWLAPASLSSGSMDCIGGLAEKL